METTEEVLQVRVTKSGDAIVHRARHLLGNANKKTVGGGGGGSGGVGGSDADDVIANNDSGGGGNVKPHNRVKSRLLAPSDPFLVHVGVGRTRYTEDVMNDPDDSGVRD